LTASQSQPRAGGYDARPADATAGSIDVAGAAIGYRIDGPAGAPLFVLANSLGTNFTMWDPQMPSLAARFRVLRYDSRGHGVSTVGNIPYTLERLAGDVLALLDHVREPVAHFCGLSVGGMVGMWLGARAASRIDRLILCNTAPRKRSPARSMSSSMPRTSQTSRRPIASTPKSCNFSRTKGVRPWTSVNVTTGD
jgi:pimeloyl-ACP methyl ester carboxylesterase